MAAGLSAERRTLPADATYPVDEKGTLPLLIAALIACDGWSRALEAAGNSRGVVSSSAALVGSRSDSAGTKTSLSLRDLAQLHLSCAIWRYPAGVIVLFVQFLAASHVRKVIIRFMSNCVGVPTILHPRCLS